MSLDHPPITIRLAAPSDAGMLRRLSERHGAPPPIGHVLLAELAGSPSAAISVETGASVGDPSRVPLLRRRRYELLSQSAGLAAGWLAFGRL